MKRTIELYGLELEVEYDYFPSEPRTYLYEGGLVSEGAEAYYEVIDVSCGGLDVSHITDEEIIEAIEDNLIDNSLKNYI